MSDKPPDRPRIDWRGANLRGISMANMNLEGADMRAADARDVNFSGSNLRYVDFRGANVQGANFQNASLYGAKMQGVEAHGADFRGSDVRLVNFGGAYMDGAMMPLPSPGEIDNGLGPQAKTWDKSELERREKTNQNGNAGNDRTQEARNRPPAEEQRRQERGRGR